MDALARSPAAPVLTQAIVQPTRVDGPPSPRIAWVEYEMDADGAVDLRLEGRGRWSVLEVGPLVDQACEDAARRFARRL